MPTLRYRPRPPKKHKYSATTTVVDGIRFDSKKEANYYNQLKFAQKTGIVDFFLRQVPLHLPGNVILRIDFLVFYSDGTVGFEDVKGMLTEQYSIKKRIAESIYPIRIEER